MHILLAVLGLLIAFLVTYSLVESFRTIAILERKLETQKYKIVELERLVKAWKSVKPNMRTVIKPPPKIEHNKSYNESTREDTFSDTTILE